MMTADGVFILYLGLATVIIITGVGIHVHINQLEKKVDAALTKPEAPK